MLDHLHNCWRVPNDQAPSKGPFFPPKRPFFGEKLIFLMGLDHLAPSSRCVSGSTSRSKYILMFETLSHLLEGAQPFKPHKKIGFWTKRDLEFSFWWNFQGFEGSQWGLEVLHPFYICLSNSPYVGNMVYQLSPSPNHVSRLLLTPKVIKNYV